MLKRKFAKHVKVGRLIVRGLADSDLAFGEIAPDRPHLDVTIRVQGRWNAWKIALFPDPCLGEAYMNGTLTIERGSLRDFMEICFLNFRNTAPAPRRGWALRTLLHCKRVLQQWNSRRIARRNVARHYDLSGELYSLFLDADRQYSCAYFEHPDASLEQAQQAKKEHILAKLLLKPGHRVLDIGSGWGGLALTLASRGGAHVTGVTLSREQLAVARERALAAGLDDRVGFELQDYRDLDGKFDRIVSVGMFEHVGTPQYQTFFDTVARLLSEDGVALLHSIGRMDEPGTASAWIDKYIFPGGYVPALSEVLPAIERTGMWVTDVEILRLHYARTLRQWQIRFAENRAAVAKLYDETFCRMWEFYLIISEMSFYYDGLMVFQIQLAKHVDTLPITRDYMYGDSIGTKDG